MLNQMLSGLGLLSVECKLQKIDKAEKHLMKNGALELPNPQRLQHQDYIERNNHPCMVVVKRTYIPIA
jgi:hypothetical protein